MLRGKVGKNFQQLSQILQSFPKYSEKSYLSCWEGSQYILWTTAIGELSHPFGQSTELAHPDQLLTLLGI